jgi:hypothetical protein
MTAISRNLSEIGWKLRSGHAYGADQAFEEGTMNREIYLPWDGYNLGKVGKDGCVCIPMTSPLRKVAERYYEVKRTMEHLAPWNFCSPATQKFMCRNMNILLGPRIDEPVKMVICWTEGGKIKGGTGHAMIGANDMNIPLFNLAIPQDWDRLENFVGDFNG